MCTSNHQFIFCTCTEQKTVPLPHYTWTLTEFIQKNPRDIRGKILAPTKKLGEGINLEIILAQLNGQDSSFDFDYQPKEGHCLALSFNHPKKPYQYFKISYRDGKWVEGGHPYFKPIIQEVAQGKIIKTSSKE